MNNDLILLDKVLEDESQKVGESPTNGMFFENFSFKQILKNYDLSEDEINEGIVDGRNDGGIDGLYIFFNGIPLNDSTTFSTANNNSKLEIIIITSKHDEGFKQAPLNSEFTTISSFFNLATDNNTLKDQLNEDVLTKRKLFIDCYIKNVTKIKDINIRYIYISRGEISKIDSNIFAISNNIVNKTKELINICACEFTYIGASELLALYRVRKDFDLNLPFVKNLSADNGKFIILCKLSDYYKFISKENGELKRYLFDSNVRDFNGLNKTNSDIMNSLENNDDVDFWWLNNGITILSSSAYDVGNMVKIENVQIINGLQTSFCIHDYFKNNENRDDERKVMVKIITETNPETRDKIIRATNNQTSIQEQSLHATDKIQRDIEQILLHHSIYYERRKNYYINQNKNASEICTPLFLLSGCFCLVKHNIKRAISSRQRLMTNEEIYKSIFEETNIESWPRIFKIIRASELCIQTVEEAKNNSSPKKYRILRSIISYLALSKHFGKHDYTDSDISKIPMEDIDNFDFRDPLLFLFKEYGEFDKTKWGKTNFIYKVVKTYSKRHSIENLKYFFAINNYLDDPETIKEDTQTI